MSKKGNEVFELEVANRLRDFTWNVGTLEEGYGTNIDRLYTVFFHSCLCNIALLDFQDFNQVKIKLIGKIGV